jgi:hypothetical protein
MNEGKSHCVVALPAAQFQSDGIIIPEKAVPLPTECKPLLLQHLIRYLKEVRKGQVFGETF